MSVRFKFVRLVRTDSVSWRFSHLKLPFSAVNEGTTAAAGATVFLVAAVLHVSNVIL